MFNIDIIGNFTKELFGIIEFQRMSTSVNQHRVASSQLNGKLIRPIWCATQGVASLNRVNKQLELGAMIIDLWVVYLEIDCSSAGIVVVPVAMMIALPTTQLAPINFDQHVDCQVNTRES